MKKLMTFTALAMILFPFRNAYPQTILNSDQIWQHSDIKHLDPWGDVENDYQDIIAAYVNENPTDFLFRIDFLDMLADYKTELIFLIDYTQGGNTSVSINTISFSTDLEWDVCIFISDSSWYQVFDTQYNDNKNHLSNLTVNSKLDFISFALSKDMFSPADFNFQMQIFTLNNNLKSDQTSVFHTADSTGRAKLVIHFMNAFIGYGPHAVSWYDGFALRPEIRPGDRRGFKYLLDAAEKYKVPLTINDLRIEQLPGNEYLPINQRIRTMAQQGLLDPLTTLNYGYFMPWQSDLVDTKAINIAASLRQHLDLPVPDVIYPYEAMLKVQDVDLIKELGFKAIYGLDQYRYWFGWINDWSDPDYVEQEIRMPGKIHKINNIDFVFETRIGNYQGIAGDDRWGVINWSNWSEYDQFVGTDDGLHLWWRRLLHDMAMDEDQERYFTVGTDLPLTAWMFEDDADKNFAWIAHHHWIEATTFSSIISRSWTPIDHGVLPLAPEDLLVQYPMDGDTHYNAYFSDYYYGSISDGHSPLVQAGDSIESYYDYVPYLRDNEQIPANYIMGDDQTPESILYKTLENLTTAPDNDLTTLAWLAYFNGIAEQTFHAQHFYTGPQAASGDYGGKYLHPAAKFRANDVRQVNKILKAAQWVQNIIDGLVQTNTTVLAEDVDLDGEQEYIMYNNSIFVLFENDGGRAEYAFSYSPEYGPVQHVAPKYQQIVTGDGWGWNYEDGEIAIAPTWDREVDAVFAEDITQDGNLDYPVYQATVTDSSLEFLIPGGLIKTFALDGQKINAHYKIPSGDYIEIGFGLVVNLLNMFEKDWCDAITIQNEDKNISMFTSNGGRSEINYTDENIYFISLNSFLDSPVRDEQKIRENLTDYPSGHWFFFPYNTVLLGASGEVNISLSLSSDNTSTHINEKENSSSLPVQFYLYPGYPNPFNPATTFCFDMPQPQYVKINIYNECGQHVKTLTDKKYPAGSFQIKWDATNDTGIKVNSGVYFVQCETVSYKSVQKCLYLK